jgi:hypothetical protein
MTDLATIIADAEIVANLAKMAIEYGEEVAPYVQQFYRIVVEKETLTVQERQDTEAALQAFRDRLNAPQAGDPDYVPPAA